jgi:hypothetical protein
MKKNILYIIIIVGLIILAVIFYLQNEKSTLLPGSSDFALEQGQRVDSIALKQDSVKFTLVRENNYWSLNGNLPARKRAIEDFFQVLTGLQIEAPATKSNRDEIIDLVRQNPIHVKIYKRGRLIKNYMVEDSKYKRGATYMMMKDASSPFLMNYPGFNGDLARLYHTDPVYWRDRTIFSYSGIDIRNVKVEYKSEAKHSFELNYINDKFNLIDLSENKKITPLNNSRASRYYSYYSDIRYEEIIQRSSLKDSLQAVKPFCTITVRDKNDKVVSLQAYRKPSTGKKDAFGQTSSYDLNHLYGVFSEYEEILLIKYTEIDPLFKEIDYFRVD